jgi:hypothetical protein
MSDLWFYGAQDKDVGPISFSDLIEHLKTQSSWRETAVWSDGFKDWTVAGSVPRIRAALVSPPPRKPQSAAPQKRWSFKKILSTTVVVIACIIGAAIGKPLGIVLYRSLSDLGRPSDAQQIELGLKKAVEILKAKIPQKVDDVTTMVDATQAGTELTYMYEVDESKLDIDGSFSSELKKVVQTKVCGGKMRPSIDKGASYRFVYRNQKSEQVANFTIGKIDCI